MESNRYDKIVVQYCSLVLALTSEIRSKDLIFLCFFGLLIFEALDGYLMGFSLC